MRRTSLLLVAVVVVAGCEWDGPPRDVRVVPAGATTAELASADGSPTDGAGIDPAGVPMPPDAPRSPGLEDRPSSFGALDLPATVAVVGDSLTVAATDEITGALTRAGVQVVVVDAQESRRMATGRSGLRSGVAAIEDVLTEHEPDLWVVALGTNDVGAGSVPDRFVADLRTAVAAIPPTAPLVWVDVWIRDRLDEVVEANAILRGELARRPAATAVVDWFSSGTVDEVVTADGIHLTATGEQRFASEITDAVIAVAIAAG